MADIKIDTLGLKCPMPIVNISKEIRNMTPGKVLEVMADDPAFGEDIKSFCKIGGHILDSLTEDKGVFTAVIRKA